MTTTIVDILNKSLVVRKIVIYEYSAFHVLSEQVMKHYYTDDSYRDNYANINTWKDLEVKQIVTKILSVDGGYAPYEGNEVGLSVKIEDKERYISLEVDKEFELI